MELHDTVMGKRFFEAQMPRLIDAIENLSKELKVQNSLMLKIIERLPNPKNILLEEEKK